MKKKLYREGRLEKNENRIIKIIFVIMFFYTLSILIDIAMGIFTFIILISLITICILSSYSIFILYYNGIKYKIKKKREYIKYSNIRIIYISDTTNNFQIKKLKKKKIFSLSKIFKEKSHLWLTICSENLNFLNDNKLLLKQDIDKIAKQQKKYCFSFVCEKIKDLDLLFRGYEGNYVITQSFLLEHLDVIKEITDTYNINRNRIEVIKDINYDVENVKFSFSDIDDFFKIERTE